MADIKIMTQADSFRMSNLWLPPNNEIIVDDMGEPSVMVKIPKLSYADVGIGNDNEKMLPAFIVDGKEVPYIYVSKYQNIVKNGRAYSLPYQRPKVGMTIDEAHTYCKNKGDGWHLMTNAEWAAIALWCKKHDCMPYGNNYYFRDWYNRSDRGAEAPETIVENELWRQYTLTGSGPKDWFHNNDFSGIADLNGNVAEWVGGLRLVNGVIQVIKDNDAATLDKSGNQDNWMTIKHDGTYGLPGTTDVFSFNMNNGIIYDGRFKEMRLGNDINVTVPDILKALAIYPNDASNTYKDDLYIAGARKPEVMPTRGGHYGNVHEAGIFNYAIDKERGYSNPYIGFRSAYIPSTFQGSVT